MDEARSNIREAIELVLKAYRESGSPHSQFEKRR